MSASKYFDGLVDPRGDDGIAERARHRARLRDARDRLDRLEEIRDVALLGRVDSVEEISRFLQLDIGYVQRTARLVELWQAAGRDPFERKADEFVLAAFVDHGLDNRQAREELVHALRAIVSAQVTTGTPRASADCDPSDEPASRDIVVVSIWDELRRLVSDGFLTDDEFDQISEPPEGDVPTGPAPHK